MARLVESVAGGAPLRHVVLGHEAVERLDDLPVTDWSYLARYRSDARRVASQAQVYLSRGCPFDCAFCMERAKREVSWRAYSVERALEAIRDAVYQTKPGRLSLADLAGNAHVTPEHLCRLFRKHLALGPLECLRLARLQFAATLLSRSNMAVKEVADASGFVSPYHFSRAFQQTYGVPPRDYRAALLAGKPVKQNPIVRLLPLRA